MPFDLEMLKKPWVLAVGAVGIVGGVLVIGKLRSGSAGGGTAAAAVPPQQPQLAGGGAQDAGGVAAYTDLQKQLTDLQAQFDKLSTAPGPGTGPSYVPDPQASANAALLAQLSDQIKAIQAQLNKPPPALVGPPAPTNINFGPGGVHQPGGGFPNQGYTGSLYPGYKPPPAQPPQPPAVPPSPAPAPAPTNNPSYPGLWPGATGGGFTGLLFPTYGQLWANQAAKGTGDVFTWRNVTTIAMYGTGSPWRVAPSLNPLGRAVMNETRINWGLNPLTDAQMDELEHDLESDAKPGLAPGHEPGRQFANDPWSQMLWAKWNLPFQVHSQGMRY